MRLRGDLLALLLLSAAFFWAFGAALDLPFWNSDDWFHLNLGAGLVGLEPDAWQLALTGTSRTDALRVLPCLSWALDWALFGTSPAGYYGTNLAVVLLTGLLLYSLVRSLGGGLSAASFAACFFLFCTAALQPLYLLSSRYDGVAVLLTVMTLAAWPKLRSRRWGRGLVFLLYAGACFSKGPVGLQLPLLLWVLERFLRHRAGEEARGVLRALAPGLVISGIWVLCLLLAVGSRSFDPDPWALASFEVLGRRLATLLLPSVAMGWHPTGLEYFALGFGLLGLVLALVHRRPHRELSLLGLVVLGVALLPVLPWILAEEAGDSLEIARYFLLPSVGMGMLLAGVLVPGPAARHRRPALVLALVFVLCLAVTGVRLGRYQFARQSSSSTELLSVLEALLRDAGPGTRVLVGVRQPDLGATSLLASPVWKQLFPEVPMPGVFLQGSQVLLQAGGEGYSYGSFRRVEGEALDLGTLPQGTRLVWQVPQGGELRWVSEVPPEPRPPSALASRRAGRWNVRVQRPYPERSVYRELRRFRLPFASLPLPAGLGEACSLALQVEGEGADLSREIRASGMVASGRFGIASFGGQAEAFLLPFEGGSNRTVLFLPNLAGPLPARGPISLLPSNSPGSWSVTAVELLGCGALGPPAEGVPP